MAQQHLLLLPAVARVLAQTPQLMVQRWDLVGHL
jgi:hypothetical protein